MIQKEVSCTNLTPFGRVFKIRNFFCMIFDRIINVSCVSLTPLGRVFKIRHFFLHDFEAILPSYSATICTG